ncbi:MAG: ankyrin repeat domain-containing protein [Brevinematales bacterium]|jgi:ankyrin repeat protein
MKFLLIFTLISIPALIFAASETLFDAAVSGDTAFIKAYKGDINQGLNANGSTALMIAAFYGKTEAVKLLIASGADVNIADINGDTALISAAYYGKTEAVSELIGAKALVNVSDKNGDTALILAAYAGQADAVKALLDAGANVNAADKNGDTALMLSSYNGNTGIAGELISHKAVINSANKDGDTALFFAGDNGKIETVKALLDADADTRIMDNAGNTAMTAAAAYGQTDVVNLLKEARSHTAPVKAAEQPAVTNEINTNTAPAPAAENKNNNEKLSKEKGLQMMAGLDMAFTPVFSYATFNPPFSINDTNDTTAFTGALSFGAFFDATYFRVDFSYQFTVLQPFESVNTNGAFSTNFTTNNFSDTLINIQILFKYPLAVADGFEIWPAAGLEYSLELFSGSYGTNSITNAYNNNSHFYLKLGAGANIKVADNIYIVPMILFGYDLDPSPYVDGSAFQNAFGMNLPEFMNDWNASWADWKLDFNIGVAYKF